MSDKVVDYGLHEAKILCTKRVWLYNFYMAMYLIDLTGKTFGRLTVLGRSHKDRFGIWQWNCICSCGEKRIINGQSLRRGKTNSCKCLQREKLKLPERREQCRLRNLGKKLSEETKGKLSEANKGIIKPWLNSPETAAKSKAAIKQKYLNGYTNWAKGKKFPERRGENNPNWKGDLCVNPLRLRIRNLSHTKEWREIVFKRDNFTCQECGKRGGKLNADHKKAFSLICKDNRIDSIDAAIKCAELWDTSNGRTLCRKCHLLTPNYGGKAINYVY